MTFQQHVLLISLCILNLVVHGKLVLTELMIHPLNAADATTQWFEVYNTQDETVWLNAWKIIVCNPICDPFDVPTLKSISPYGSVVFSNNGNTVSNGGVAVDIQLDFVPFPKNGSGYNAISIFPPDAVAYDDLLAWSNTIAEPVYLNMSFVPGASMAKTSALATGQDVSNWKASMTPINCNKGADKGTPGKVNSYQCPTKAPTKAPTNGGTNAPKAPTNGGTNAPKAPGGVPTQAPIVAPPAPVSPFKCGWLGQGLLCFNGCGLVGRLFGLCQS